MQRSEIRATVGLGSILALRMMGLFMILPVFALHAHEYAGATGTLVGIALGIYGLTQAVLQIPLGLLSDRIGRKTVITGGLLIFAAGSALAAVAQTMSGVILGRAVQGAGAIAATTLALVTDLTGDDNRIKAMALVGVAIGAAFVLSLIVGPLLTTWVGLSGLFWTTAGLAVVAIIVLHTVVPATVASRSPDQNKPVQRQLSRVIREPQLLHLDAGALVLHLVLMATFVVMPLMLSRSGGLPEEQHWLVYLGVVVMSVALMAPAVIYGERRNRGELLFVGAVLLLAASQAGLILFHANLHQIVLHLLLFFVAFNILEASLPALISRIAPREAKGTAIGVYSTLQFLGAFLGGLLGGWVYQHFGELAVFGCCAGLAALWFFAALFMVLSRPRLSDRRLHLGAISKADSGRIAAELRGIAGVSEAVVVVEERIAYLKVDQARVDEQALRAFSTTKA